ncbi:putative bifunctional diguanylate cyclase/phosphodiesterase [Pseudorhodoferax sp.]|uniref:putative bifunctional diguanylate cyclase/phosphodiesterase n=1 Tax=Pseudorhodoferax sp. TaxID=1993553 RepID=UPI002DD693A7|nr:EAL domain-containing protein [Pseudorhodoferax sp.]
MVDALHIGDALLHRTVIDSAPDGILLVNRSGTILGANRAMERLSGHAPDQLIGQSVGIFLPPHLRERHTTLVDTFFVQPSTRPMGMVGQLQLLRRDGGAVPIDIALGHCEADGQPLAAVFIRDMTEVSRLQSQMHYQATHDTLTGLVNRWMFGQHMQQALMQSIRQGRPLGLLLLDLDYFKAINDTHGHAVGDLVLVEVARRLKGTLRAGDLLGRLGGDEFAVLLPELMAPDDAATVADKVLRALALPCSVQGCSVDLGVSIGIACCPRDATDADTLLRYADMAMYTAKDGGRGSYASYAAHMGHRFEESLRLHDRLKLALQHDALALHYQPQVDVATGRVVGLEALLRWFDDELGTVPPDRFIPVAVNTGLILPLGEWVMKTACRQIAQWAADGLRVRVSVNLSAQQFRQRDLAERLQRCMATYGTPPELLELEVTESEAVADPEVAQQVLTWMGSLGVGVALDDFGTGYSSLSYLHQLPVTRLKIDREFIQNITSNADDATLVRAIIVLAHTLGLPVVAEGVETEAQLRFLRQHGCEAYQGWLFARALPADEVRALVWPPADGQPGTLRLA